jgi:hypothetical protein
VRSLKELLDDWTGEGQHRQQNADRSRTRTLRSFLMEAPAWLSYLLVRQVELFHGIDWEGERDSDGLMPERVEAEVRKPTTSVAQAEVLGSRLSGPDGCGDDYHVIALDLDFPAVLLPSTTADHHHLIVDHQLSHEQWEKFITVCAEVGLIEQGYADASLARGRTFLRMPWVRKGYEREDARAAFEEWLEDEDGELSQRTQGRIPIQDLPF